MIKYLNRLIIKCAFMELCTIFKVNRLTSYYKFCASLFLIFILWDTWTQARTIVGIVDWTYTYLSIFFRIFLNKFSGTFWFVNYVMWYSLCCFYRWFRIRIWISDFKVIKTRLSCYGRSFFKWFDLPVYLTLNTF